MLRMQEAKYVKTLLIKKTITPIVIMITRCCHQGYIANNGVIKTSLLLEVS